MVGKMSKASKKMSSNIKKLVKNLKFQITEMIARKTEMTTKNQMPGDTKWLRNGCPGIRNGIRKFKQKASFCL